MAVTAFAAKYFQDQLETEEGKAIGLSYFRKRGFRDDILKKFQLGLQSGKANRIYLKKLEKTDIKKTTW